MSNICILTLFHVTSSQVVQHKTQLSVLADPPCRVFTLLLPPKFYPSAIAHPSAPNSPSLYLSATNSPSSGPNRPACATKCALNELPTGVGLVWLIDDFCVLMY